MKNRIIFSKENLSGNQAVFISIIILLLFPYYLLSQMTWTIVNEPPVNEDFRNVSSIINGHVWIVGNNGFVLHSTNYGNTWEEQLKTNNIPLKGCFFINDQLGWICGWNNLWHTSNGGDSWEIQTVPNPTGLGLNEIYFINPDTGWICGDYRTIYKTINGGVTWEKQYGPVHANHKCLQDIQFLNENQGVAVGGWFLEQIGFIMVTSDGGVTWQEIEISGSNRMESVQMMEDGNVWACGQGGLLYHSADYGYTWTTQYITTGPSFSDLHFFNSQDAILASGTRCFITNDAFTTYEEYFTGSEIDVFSFEDNHSGIGTGWGGDICTTQNGMMWQSVLPFFSETGFFDPNNGWAFNWPSVDLFQTNNGGTDWHMVDTPNEGFIYDLEIIDESYGWAITTESELLKTCGSGYIWVVTGTLPDTAIFDLQFISPDIGFICGKNGFISKTVDGGENWQVLNTGLVNYFYDLCFINENEGWVVCSGNILIHTSDGGVTWDSQTFSGGIVDVKFLNNLKGFVITYNNLYSTEDGGNTWNTYNNLGTYLKEIEFTDDLYGWIISSDKVYHTFDGGIHWGEEAAFDGLNISDIFMLNSYEGWLCCSYTGTIARYMNGVAIDQPVIHNDINIFPNPANDFLYMNIPENINTFASYEICTINGKLVSYGESFKDSGFYIPIHSIKPGVYFLGFLYNGRARSYKFIKQ